MKLVNGCANLFVCLLDFHDPGLLKQLRSRVFKLGKGKHRSLTRKVRGVTALTNAVRAVPCVNKSRPESLEYRPEILGHIPKEILNFPEI